MTTVAKPETIHLVLIDAHRLETILKKARRRRKAGTIMLITGSYMLLASVIRGRGKDKNWDDATR